MEFWKIWLIAAPIWLIAMKLYDIEKHLKNK
jgi:hypothetical protein